MSKALNIIWALIMFIVLFTTFLMVKPDSQIALIYGKFKESLDGLIFLKIIILFTVIVIIIRLVSKNLNKWADEYSMYMAENSKKVLGSALSWNKTFGRFNAKMMIIFGAFMVILLTFAFLFGPVDLSKREIANRVLFECSNTDRVYGYFYTDGTLKLSVYDQNHLKLEGELFKAGDSNYYSRDKTLIFGNGQEEESIFVQKDNAIIENCKFGKFMEQQ